MNDTNNGITDKPEVTLQTLQDESHQNLCRLEEELNCLREHISPVMIEDCPMVKPEKPCSDEPHSTAMNFQAEMNLRIDRATEAVFDLRKRCKV